MSTTTSKNNTPSDLTLRSAFMDALISLTLITGAWATDWVGKYFYSAGVPFPYCTILFARDIATLLWVIGTTFRYVRYSYHELSLTLNSVLTSKLWIRIHAALFLVAGNIERAWRCLDLLSRKILLMVFIVMLAFGVFAYSKNEFYSVLPIVYWGVVFAVSPVLERTKDKPHQSFWLAAFLLFLLILLFIFTFDINHFIYSLTYEKIRYLNTIKLIATNTFNNLGNIVREMTLVRNGLIVLFAVVAMVVIAYCGRMFSRNFIFLRKKLKFFAATRLRTILPFEFYTQKIATPL